MAVNMDELLTFPRLRDDTSSYELQELHSSHSEIIRLHMMGMSAEDIAAEMNCALDKVKYTLRSQIGRDTITQLQHQRNSEAIDIADRIHTVAAKAITVLEDIMDGNIISSTKDKIDVAKEVLRMDGFTPVQRIQQDVRMGYAEKAGMDRIARRADILRASNVIQLPAAEDAFNDK